MTQKRLLFGLLALVAIGIVWTTRDGDESTAESGGQRNDRDGAHGSAPGDDTARGLAQRMRSGVAGGPGVVEGVVVDTHTGERVPYVDVIFSAPGGEITANSGGEGAYSIELRGGSYQVRALGDGVVGTPQPSLRVAGGDEPVRFDVEVQKLATLRGRVVDHEGDGVAGAAVSLVPLTAAQKLHIRTGDVVAATETGGDGSFELAVIADGTVELVATAGELRGGARVTGLVPGGERAGVIIALDPGARLAGVVVDPSGNAVAGALVHATPPGKRDEGRETETDSAGRFSFGRVSSGDVVVEASAPGFAPAPPTRVTVSSGNERELRLALQRPTVLSGRAIDGDGRPVPGVRVRAGRGGSQQKALQVFTGPDGRFSFDAVDRGPYWVSGYKPDYAVATQEGVEPPVSDLELVMTVPGGVRGRVVDGDGRPVDEFVVRVERFRPVGVGKAKEGGAGTKVSARGGSFEMSPLEPGVYDFSVAAGGVGVSTARNVVIPAGGWGEVSVTLRRGTRVQGRVLGPGGAPAAGARVTVSLAAGAGVTVTGDDGRFTIPDVAPGEQTLVASHPRLGTATVEVSVAAGESTAVSVELESEEAPAR